MKAAPQEMKRHENIKCLHPMSSAVYKLPAATTIRQIMLILNECEKSHVAFYHDYSFIKKNWLIRLLNADKRMSSIFRKIRFEFAEYFQNLAIVTSGQSG